MRNFHGRLTLENIGQFQTLLRAFLANQNYTFISTHSGLGTVPRVRVNQYLEGRSVIPGTDKTPPSRQTYPAGDAMNISDVTTSEKVPGWGMINVCDTYGVWSVTTDAYVSFKDDASSFEPRMVCITFPVGGYESTFCIIPTGPLDTTI